MVESARVKEITCLEDGHVGEVVCGSLSAPFLCSCCELASGEQSDQKVAQPRQAGNLDG
jgi:hypothetical protein